MKIKELIVVEGKDDIAAVKKAVEAEVIATNGYYISPKLLEILRSAVKRTGVIIFSDPDSAGNFIRRRLNDEVPGCKNAYLGKEEGKKGNNIGIENASPESIRRALSKVKTSDSTGGMYYSLKDLWMFGLVGTPGAELRRKRAGVILGIGETNTKQFLHRINSQGIKLEELEAVLNGLEGDL